MTCGAGVADCEKGSAPHGSDNRFGMTQQEVAEAMGISRSMVHKIEQRAMRKMRAAFEANGWAVDMEGDCE